MPYEKLKIDLLRAREQREQRRQEVCRYVDRTLVQLSLNIPGPDKVPPGAEQLYCWGQWQVLELLPLIESCSHGSDLLGPWTLLGTVQDARQLKMQLVGLESASPAGRLLDVDVYDHCGTQIGRRELGLPARSCLLCARPAVDCMRLQLHSPEELLARVEALLKPFRA